MKNPKRYSESTPLGERIEEEREATLAYPFPHPTAAKVIASKKKPTNVVVTTGTVAASTARVSSLGLAPVAEAPRIRKAANTALLLEIAPTLTHAEIDFLERR